MAISPTSRRDDQGPMLAAVSRRIVGLLKEHYGKGPTKARTYYSGDLVVVLLSGGYTQAEKTLIEDGRSRAVMDLRAELQEVMNGHYRKVIEEELQRKVVAFMSAAHHDPDYNAELFILAPEGDEGELEDIPVDGIPPERSPGDAEGDEPQYAAED